MSAQRQAELLSLPISFLDNDDVEDDDDADDDDDDLADDDDMDGNADTVSVAAGAFDSPLPLVPQYHIFVASKAPWHGIHDALPRFDAYPPDDA